MKAIYRERTITEQMDYILGGDRPVDYFLLSSIEFDRFLEEGHYAKVVDRERMEEYYTCEGIRIIVE
jgi:hypothetical protein